jgi:hypothetical protein
MKLGIMQPYFLPYIGYWQLINAVDKYVIYEDVQFIKGGWINRNNLLLNGDKFMFNLILIGASPNKLINEISIHPDQRKLIKTIESSYKKAPYFATVFPIINQIVDFENKNLAKFIGNSILQICNYLDIKTNIIFSSKLQKDNELKGQDKIIYICKALHATEYFNAIGGQELYSKAVFEMNSIQLKFLKTEPVEYKHFSNQFIPRLSILDVMMFNSVEEVKAMLDNFELI